MLLMTGVVLSGNSRPDKMSELSGNSGFNRKSVLSWNFLPKVIEQPSGFQRQLTFSGGEVGGASSWSLNLHQNSLN